MITAELITGRPIILLDNLSEKRKLDSAALASVVTLPWWTDRLLGESTMLHLRNNALWLMTGNNPRLSGEMSRRCIRLRIDPRIDMPWLRAGFKHPLITEWARENRSALVHAALTVVQAWIAAGKPLNARRLGSFESWSGIMGGVLEVAGIPGFLGNLNELYQAADTDGQMWREFTGSWWEAYREEPKKAGELNQFCEERDLMVSVRGDGSARSQQTRLGKALAAKRDRVFNGLTVKQSSHHNHKTGVLYALALADGGDNADRVMVQVANDTQLRWARVELSLYHVGSTVRLDLWAGYIVDWQSDAGPEFTVKASDILSALTLSSPVSTISRQCWRRLGKDGCLWNPASDTRDLTHFSGASTTVCDLGYNTPNGCLAHGVQGGYGATYCTPQGVLLRSGSVGLTFPGVLPIIGGPVGTFVGSVSSWYPRTSIVSDSIYGGTLAEVWHHDDGQPRYALPVTCRIAAGRHEDQYYAALGIVCKGPIGAFTPPQMYDANADGIKETFVGSTLDGQTNHGFKTDDNGNTKQPPTYPTENPLLGLRQTLGADPAGAHDYFSLGRVSETGVGWFQQPSDNSWMVEVPWAHSAYNGVFAAGVALCEIRITQVKEAPFTSPGQHTMVACISQGLTGWVWTAPETRTTAPGCTNPFWVAVNTYLSAIGLATAEFDTQEATFDSAAAIAAAAIADTSVPRIIGTGTEVQFRFKGSIDDRKPTRDWLQSILNSGCGYYTWSFGRLKVGCRSNASAAAAFTSGNMLFSSLRLSPIAPRFEKLTVSFADQEYQFQGNTIDYTDQDHAARNNRSANPLVGQFAVSGCSTKSQAGRLAVVRAREELGGTTQAEQDAARIASWKTTILALETEAGMVVSVADPDVPGGTASFRIQRWSLNADWSINIQAQTVTASMYDVTTGPKPADVAPAPIPIEPPHDSDVPPAPLVDVDTGELDARAVQLTNLRFATAANTASLESSAWSFYYVTGGDTDWLLSVALAPGATSLTLDSTPVGLATGDCLQIGTELLLCGTIVGAMVNVTRAALCSPAAVATQPQWTVVERPRKMTVHVALPADFTNTPGAASWALVQSLPGVRVVAVVGVATNAYGDSPTGVVCLTNNAQFGLVTAAEGTATLNVSADTTLPLGDLVVNVTATGGSAVNIHLADGTDDLQHTVTVKWKAGNTQDVNILVSTGSGDTIDLSGSPVVLNASKTIWTGVAG